MRLLIFILIVLLATVSVQAGDLSSQEIKEARKLYIGKCAKCHKLHDPAQYTDTDWAGWMKKMYRKSRLSPQQTELLSKYHVTVRAGAK
ncbi:MAG: hypothetical protein JWQ04_1981 [Pedosphaera sp.]|nr:hypothetical protein [Pedosphaera sp.]